MYTILLVEDEIEILMALEKFFTSQGFTPVAVQTGSKAIEIVNSGTKIDIAILDLKMPGMMGFDCLKEIRKIKTDIPVIFLTGSIHKARYADTLKSFNLGIEDVLGKPIDLYILLEEVKKRLEK